MTNNLDCFDVCVVGAGVVGLAIAREFCVRGKTVLIIEKSSHYGTEISSRNSEVIHAGIYYPKDSLKATLCVEGKERLYQYCRERSISHRRIGKLIVAQSDTQMADLDDLRKKADANGVRDLEFVSKIGLNQLEPFVSGACALYSPSTGIIDSHELMTSFVGEIESCGGLLSLNTAFVSADRDPMGFKVLVESVDENFEFRCERLVNAAGLDCREVALRIGGIEEAAVPQLYYCKGSYFSLLGLSPFRHLIYPMPEANTTGLGIHATLDLTGRARFGPDVEYIEDQGYDVAESSKEKFVNAIRLYFPSLDESKLCPAYAGIRPKLQGQGEPQQDFQIDSPYHGLVNLFGIESPGLTSCLAIANRVADIC